MTKQFFFKSKCFYNIHTVVLCYQTFSKRVGRTYTLKQDAKIVPIFRLLFMGEIFKIYGQKMTF